jgi:hypothetical protein|tara:strand:- start:62 stop:367 length:306 start_codon:yes stop_codon:yes gene_type:complete
MPPLKLLGAGVASVVPANAAAINGFTAQAATHIYIVNNAANEVVISVFSSATATSTTDTLKGSLELETLKSIIITKAAGDKLMCGETGCTITPVAIGSQSA